MVLIQQDHKRWEYSTVERFGKDLKKDKKKRTKKNYILKWGGSSGVFIPTTYAHASSHCCWWAPINKTIKDGGIAPWKDLNKEKR